jgi:addiction module HigA family antidote
MATRLRSARAVKPGHILKEELEARGWTQKAFAEVIGRPVQMVNEIISAKKSITPETALLFSAAFGTSSQLWLNLESSYRLWLTEEETNTSEVTRRAEQLSAAPKDRVRGSRRSSKRTRFHLDVLVEQVEGQYVAHCLQLDLMATAATEAEAIEDVLQLVQDQLASVHAIKPAPPEAWLKLWRVYEREHPVCQARQVSGHADIEAVICHA